MVLQQPIARLLTKGGNVDHRPVHKGTDRADGMNAPKEAAHPLKHVGVVQFRRTATASR